MKFKYIRAAGIKALVKENNRRCSVDFMDALNIRVYELVEKCCKQFNGHKRTLDRTIIGLMK
jgi:hypothetical protein